MKHIILSGKRENTALLRRLLPDDVPIYGFVTQKLPPEADGFHPVYLHPASQPEAQWVYTSENLIGTCNRREQQVHTEVFETLGVALIEAARPDGILVMNELGFMEAAAERFMKSVLTALDGEIPVLAAIKARRDIAFLEQIRSHPNVALFSVTAENAKELFVQIKSAFLA